MNQTTIKINWDFVSRLLISILFIFAGLGKMKDFSGTSSYIDSVLHTGSLSSLITALVILIEVAVAAVYVWGKWNRDLMAYILIAFTALTVILFHSDWNNQLNIIMSLKNIAIIGGLIATLNSLHLRRVAHHNSK